MITLYSAPRSGNAYKVKLVLSLLGLEFDEVSINLQTGENRGRFVSRNESSRAGPDPG